LSDVDARFDPDKARARTLLKLAEPYLSEEVVPIIRGDIDGNEPALGLETLLDDLLVQNQPLPRKLVEQLRSGPDKILDLFGTIKRRLDRLATLASDEVEDRTEA
jgi:hypothetical protein